MSKFIVFHDDLSVGLTFNQMAARLKKHADIKILEDQSIDSPTTGMIVIETSNKTAMELRGAYEGWSISPDYKIHAL